MVLAAVVPYCTSTPIVVLYTYAKATKTSSYSLKLANVNMLAMLIVGGVAQVRICFKEQSKTTFNTQVVTLCKLWIHRCNKVNSQPDVGSVRWEKRRRE